MKHGSPFYVWLLPLLCGTCSLLHSQYPGDENAMWIIGSLPGLWIAPFAFLVQDAKSAAPLLIALALAAAMLPVGLAMDFFRIRKTLWAVLFGLFSIAILLLSVLSYPSIERAINKNGSWWAYIFFSINFGVYTSVIISAILTLFSRLVKS